MSTDLQHLGYEGDDTAFCGSPVTKRVSFVTEPVCPGPLHAPHEAVALQGGFIRDLTAYLETGSITLQMGDGEVIVKYVDEEPEDAS